jgi:hypothetical protein
VVGRLLKANFPTTNIATDIPLHDKLVVVHLSKTLMTRYEYCIFHRTLDGSDPVVASKKLADAVHRLKDSPARNYTPRASGAK